MLLSLVVLLVVSRSVWSQCPPDVQYPCTCSSTRYESVSIVCDHAQSLDQAIGALGRGAPIIDSLIISNTPIPRLPPYAFRGLTLKRLALRNNSLSDVDELAFESPTLNYLGELEIRNNLLTSVPRTGLTRLRNLTILVLAKNQIQSLGPGLFRDYASRFTLKKLDLSANRISAVDPGAFTDLTAVQDFNFDKNSLTAVPTEALRRLSTLEDLSFGINQLENIAVDALPFPNLKSLSLEVNSIRRIDPAVFQWLPNLLYLYLSANKFETIDPNMLRHIPRLKVLAMGGNGITRIEGASFGNVPELVRLELSNCQISQIDPGAFRAIPKVQVVVLNKNRLQSIPQNLFQGLVDLYSLDLKANLISSVEPRAFSRLPALKHLDLSSNQLTTMDQTIFTGTFERTVPITTRVLYLYENQWTCDETLEWFRRWLRDNSDIMIDAPGYPLAVCRKPENLNGWHLRLLDPPITSNPNTNLPLIIDNGGNTKLSGMSLAAVILGVILGIFFLTLLLLLVVRYFVSKRRRDDKLEDVLSSGASGVGSAYPSPPLQSPSGARSGYFLNRPWYWWF